MSFAGEIMSAKTLVPFHQTSLARRFISSRCVGVERMLLLRLVIIFMLLFVLLLPRLPDCSKNPFWVGIFSAARTYRRFLHAKHAYGFAGIGKTTTRLFIHRWFYDELMQIANGFLRNSCHRP